MIYNTLIDAKVEEIEGKKYNRFIYMDKCPLCAGRGIYNGKECFFCEGKKLVRRSKYEEIKDGD